MTQASGTRDQAEYYSDDEEDFYVAIKSFQAQEKGDLNIVKGEVLEFLEEDENGWWVMENKDGEEGLVPPNFLRPYEYDEDEETMIDNTNNNKPETHDKIEMKKTEVKVSKWNKIRKEVAPNPVNITDVLSAFGAFPVGFVEPTLGSYVLRADDYSLRTAIVPKLSESGVEFQDMFWSKTRKSIRPISTKILLEMSIIRCKNIPLLPTGVEIISRNLRLALHDGVKVVGNVLTLNIAEATHDEKDWLIEGKNKNYLSEILIRSNINSVNLAVLFEFSFTYVKSPPKKILRFSDGSVARYTETLDEDIEELEREKLRKRGDYSEISCGWALLPLYQLNGVPMAPKQHELEIKRGKPFQPQPVVNQNRGKLRQLMSANRKPVLLLKTRTPAAVKLENLNKLPTNILIYTSYCVTISLYRRIFARNLCSSKSGRNKPSNDPVLSVFPQVIELPYVMEAIVNALTDKWKKMTKIHRQDFTLMEKHFTEIVISVGCLYDIQSLQPAAVELNKSIKLKNEQENWNIERPDVVVGYTVHGNNKVLQELLSPHKEHIPFDSEELRYTL